MKNRIYLDHAATTTVSKAVLDAMLPFFTECPGNASAVYATGREARKAVEEARKQVAAAIGAEPREILFTGGGSESDNQAVKGTAFALREKGKHIITTAVEHPAVLNTCKWLEKQGFEVTYLTPDAYGFISPESVKDAIRKDTILVSIMTANNEIGTLEPVGEIGRICRGKGVLFHTDAVQAVGMIPCRIQDLNADMVSMSAHKFHGPKGVGALYIRKGTRMDALIHGGSQEKGLRAGTENVPGIVGMGKAIGIAADEMPGTAERVCRLRNMLIHMILDRICDVKLNGHPEKRLPNNCHLSFAGIDSEALLLRMDLEGIAVSGGSACTSGSVEPSHVLQAIGLSDEYRKGSIRLTLGRETTEQEMIETAETITRIVTDLRSMCGR